jgi:Ca-activated chloride channel family protein
LIGMGSLRHVDFLIRVSGPMQPTTSRAPLALGLVLDRSGSMGGPKIDTARRAALAVLDRLTEKDRIGAVVFDERIDVLQERAPATREVKARLRAELMAVQPRGSTALHEEWLTGCRAIAPRVQSEAVVLAHPQHAIGRRDLT